MAYALAETARIVPYVARIAELGRTGHPWAVAFDAVCRGAAALLSNDWRRAEEILAPVVEPPAEDASLGMATYFYARAQVASGHLREAAHTIDRMPADHKARVYDGVLGVQVAVAQGLGADVGVLDEIRAVAEARLDRRPIVVRRNARCRLAVGWATLGDLARRPRAADRARADRRSGRRDDRRGAARPRRRRRPRRGRGRRRGARWPACPTGG